MGSRIAKPRAKPTFDGTFARIRDFYPEPLPNPIFGALMRANLFSANGASSQSATAFANTTAPLESSSFSPPRAEKKSSGNSTTSWIKGSAPFIASRDDADAGANDSSIRTKLQNRSSGLLFHNCSVTNARKRPAAGTFSIQCRYNRRNDAFGRCRIDRTSHRYPAFIRI